MTTQNFDLVFHHLQVLKTHTKGNLTYGIDSPPHTNMAPIINHLIFFSIVILFQSESLRKSAKKPIDFGWCWNRSKASAN